MFEKMFVFGFLLANFLSVHGGDSLQMTNLDNGTFQHQTKRSSSQYRLPYTDEIRHPIFDGKEIYIGGAIRTRDRSLTIKLCETESCLNDIEFQADIRYKVKRVVMNYMRNLQYGQPAIGEGIPLTLGGTLQIKIVISPQEFKIYLNNASYTFTTVVRLTKLKYIKILGISQINWILYSYTKPPMIVRFNDQLQEKRIIVTGTPCKHSYRFSINLKNWNLHANNTHCEYGNVALHLDVRFDGTKMVVFDSKRTAHNWNHWRTLGRFPFAENIQFKLQITIRHDKYEFLFDDGGVYNWEHRTGQIDMVCIRGDVTVHNILTT